MGYEAINHQQFKAKPVPHSEPFVFKPQPVVPVKAAPFNLRTEERGEFAERTFMERLDREKRQAEEARNFKANPMLVVDQPFVCLHSFITFVYPML